MTLEELDTWNGKVGTCSMTGIGMIGFMSMRLVIRYALDLGLENFFVYVFVRFVGGLVQYWGGGYGL